jgi:integrase
VALFYMLFVTAARPLEIARLRVRDYLDARGAVRRESVLPAEASLNGQARPLYFATRRLDDALAAYLQVRVESRQELGAAGGYRGLDPDSPLFLNSRGERFRLIDHGEAGHRRTLCRPILETYRRILRQAGLRGVTTRSIRRSVAIRMHERGASESQIGDMIGISNRSGVRELLRRPRPRLDELVADLV